VEHVRVQLAHIPVHPAATIHQVIQSQGHQLHQLIIGQLLQAVEIPIKAQAQRIPGQLTHIPDLQILKGVLLQQVLELPIADPQTQVETLIADRRQAQVHPDQPAAVRVIAVLQDLPAVAQVIVVLHDHQAAVQATAARHALHQAAVRATAAVQAPDHPEAAIAADQAVPDHLLPLHHHQEVVVQDLQDHRPHLLHHLHRTEDNRTTYKPD